MILSGKTTVAVAVGALVAVKVGVEEGIKSVGVTIVFMGASVACGEGNKTGTSVAAIPDWLGIGSVAALSPGTGLAVLVNVGVLEDGGRFVMVVVGIGVGGKVGKNVAVGKPALVKVCWKYAPCSPNGPSGWLFKVISSPPALAVVREMLSSA